MRLSTHPLSYIPVLLLGLFPASAIAGVLSGSVDVSACGPGFNQSTTSPNFVSIVGSDSGTIHDLQGPPGTIVSCSGHGTADASYGILKISGNAAGTAGVILDAGFQDSITMSAPGVANLTPGTITYQISVSGLLHVTDVIGGPQASASASWDLTAGLGGTTNNPN